MMLCSQSVEKRSGGPKKRKPLAKSFRTISSPFFALPGIRRSAFQQTASQRGSECAS
jgi:hypothetical protein